MDNPGLKRGLAVDFQYGQRTNDLARQNNAMRQAQIYSENKAKLLADDFDYNNAMNAWDNAAVKEFARGKLKEVGNFMRANPDFESNIEKRIAYKNLTKELKDNKALNEGLQVDGNIKAMQAWRADPKNAPLANSEDFAPIQQAYENYVKTGSIDGVTANRKLFTFTPPEELVDTTTFLSKYAQMTALNGQNTKWLANGAASIHKFATDNDKGLAAEGAINDREGGRYIQKEYNEYLSKLGEGSKPLTLKQYVVNKMQPYFKGDEYQNFSYQTQKQPSDRDNNTKTARNYFDELYSRAEKAKGQPVATGVEGLHQYLTGGKDQLNASGMQFESSDGNFINIKGGIVNDFTTAGSETKMTKDGLKMSVLVNIPVDSSTDLDRVSDFIGEDIYDFGVFSDNIKKGYSKNAWTGTMKDGTPSVTAKLWVPAERTNTSTTAAYNYGMHGKQEAVDSDYFAPEQETVKVSDLVKRYGKAGAQEIVNKHGDKFNFVNE